MSLNEASKQKYIQYIIGIRNRLLDQRMDSWMETQIRTSIERTNAKAKSWNQKRIIQLSSVMGVEWKWLSYSLQLGRESKSVKTLRASNKQHIPFISFWAFYWPTHSQKYNNSVYMLPSAMKINPKQPVECMALAQPRRASSSGQSKVTYSQAANYNV